MPSPSEPRHAPDTASALRAWGLGALLGLQSAVIGVLLVTVPVVLAFVTTSGSPATASIAWSDAAAAGLKLWLLAHGGALAWPGFAVSLVPLGLTALAIGTVAYSVRTSQLVTWAGFAGLLIAYAAVVIAAAAVPLAHVQVTQVPRLAAGVVLVTGLGTWAGRRHEGATMLFTSRVRRLLPVLPAPAAAGMRGAWRAARWQWVAGLVAVIVQVATHTRAITVASGQLGPDAAGTALLILGQLAFLPALAAWAVACLAGPGFAIGPGSYGPFAVQPAPLPAIPVFAALPEHPWPGALPWLAMAVLAAIAAWCVARALRLSPPATWGGRAGCVAAAGITSALAWLLIAFAASGLAGTPALGAGPDVWLLAGAMGAIGLAGGTGGLVIAAIVRREQPTAKVSGPATARRIPGTGPSAPRKTASRRPPRPGP